MSLLLLRERLEHILVDVVAHFCAVRLRLCAMATRSEICLARDAIEGHRAVVHGIALPGLDWKWVTPVSFAVADLATPLRDIDGRMWADSLNAFFVAICILF